MNKHILFAFLLLFIYYPIYATNKHALIIAISKYPVQNGWAQLASNNDAQYIRTTLLKHDFKNEEIKLVADSEATVDGIITAFKQLELETNAGDVVVIHFSCHGQQVESLDPNKLGGLDQCVVSYNALKPRLSKDFKKDQAAYLRGQTIGLHLQAIRRKAGKDGDVVVFMDYCHSGAGTRGVGKKRGGEPPFMNSNNVVKKTSTPLPSDICINTTKPQKSDAELSPFIVISATRPEESDLETDDNGIELGSLTYAISKSFDHLDANITYRSLFTKIQSVMNEIVPEQHPLIEGSGLDKVLFGGKFVPQKPYVEIERFNNDTELVARMGLFGGLDKDAKVMLYPAGTNDPAKATALASGKVISADNFTSTIALDKSLPISKAADGWIFITEPSYHLKPLHISIANNKADNNKSVTSVFTDADIAIIKSNMVDMPMISFEGNPDLMIVKGKQQDSIIAAIDGSLVTTIPDIPKNLPLLKDRMKEYSKYKFLKELDLKSNDANVEVIILPIKNGKVDSLKFKSSISGYDFHNNDSIWIAAKNNGKKDAYINILDMQPDGAINALFPKKKDNILANELKIRPGEYHVFSDHGIAVSPPYGVEVLKVFVSTEEIDMESLATMVQTGTRGITSRGNLSAMEKLVKESNGIATRGLSTINSETSEGSAYNLIFNIVK